MRLSRMTVRLAMSISHATEPLQGPGLPKFLQSASCCNTLITLFLKAMRGELTSLVLTPFFANFGKFVNRWSGFPFRYDNIVTWPYGHGIDIMRADLPSFPYMEFLL